MHPALKYIADAGNTCPPPQCECSCTCKQPAGPKIPPCETSTPPPKITTTSRPTPTPKPACPNGGNPPDCCTNGGNLTNSNW